MTKRSVRFVMSLVLGRDDPCGRFFWETNYALFRWSSSVSVSSSNRATDGKGTAQTVPFD
jgi:hypothetical protein